MSKYQNLDQCRHWSELLAHYCFVPVVQSVFHISYLLLKLCMLMEFNVIVWCSMTPQLISRSLLVWWSKRGNINTAALVTIAQCNTLVARCSRQLIGPAD